jgi:TP901 family phage tail tape measure protein
MASANVIELFVKIVGDTSELGKKLKEASANFKEFGKSLGDIAKTGALAFAAMGTAIAGSLAMAAKAAMPVEDALVAMRIQLQGKTEPATINALQRAAMDVARDFNLELIPTIKAATQALKDVSPEELPKFLERAAALSKVSGNTIEDSVQFMTAAMDAFGISTAEAFKASDVFFNLQKNDGPSLGEVSMLMGRVGAQAKALGITYKDLGAAMGAMSDAGIPARDQTSTMLEMMKAIISPTIDQAAALEALGVDTSETAIKTRGFSAVLTDLLKKIDSTRNSKPIDVVNEEKLGKAQTKIADLMTKQAEIEGKLSKLGHTPKDEKLREKYSADLTKMGNQIQDLKGKAGATVSSMTGMEAALALGGTNASAWLAMSADGASLLTSKLGITEKSVGEVDQAMKEVKASAGEAFKSLGSQAKAGLLVLGEAVLHAFTPLALQLAGLLKWVVDFAMKNSQLVQAFMAVAGVAAVLALAISGILTLVLGIAGAIGIVTAGWIPLLAGLSIVPLIAPIFGLIAFGIAAIAANLDGIKKWVQENTPLIRASVTQIYLSIAIALRDAWARIKEALAAFGPAFGELTGQILSQVMQAIRDVASWVADTAIPWVTTKLVALIGFIRNALKVVSDNWPAIKTMLLADLALIQAAVGLVWQMFKNLWNVIVAVLSGSGGEGGGWKGFEKNLQRFLNFTTQLFEVFTKILEVVTAIVKAVGDVVSGAAKIPGKIGGALSGTSDALGGAAFSAYSAIESFAGGGVFDSPSGLAMLHGPEAVIPLSNGSIPVAIQGSSGPVSITINSAPGQSPEQIAQAVAQVIYRRRGSA